MRPIMLSGHERSLTQIKYNSEGDLLFSASKDHVINVWHSHNGERLGTYNGHNGSVWSIDADCEYQPSNLGSRGGMRERERGWAARSSCGFGCEEREAANRRPRASVTARSTIMRSLFAV